MATRLRFTSEATAPAVSPALQTYLHNAPATVRRVLKSSDSSALSTVAYNPDSSDHIVAGDSLACQFVSNPMVAGITFTVLDTIKWCLQCLESNAGNNLNLQLFISIVSQDGATVRHTLIGKTEEPTELATVLTSRFHSASQTGTGYTTVLGDRLVVEVAVEGTPVATSGVQAHNASIRFGNNGAGGDLLENDTQTGTTLNPWIEFVPTITFVTPTKGQVSWAEFEIPLVGTKGRISWSEFEVPLVATRGRISWTEFEIPLVPTKGLVSWAEFEIPTASSTPTRGLVSWAEFEVPDPPTPTKGLISWAEFEIPNSPTPTRGRSSWMEFETPFVATRGRISWSEFEVPNFGSPPIGAPSDSNINIMMAYIRDLFSIVLFTLNVVC
jgi:hypothetical protein